MTLLDKISEAADEIQDLRWRAEAYDSIDRLFENKPMTVCPGVDHTTEVENQVAQLVEWVVEWDGERRAWVLRD